MKSIVIASLICLMASACFAQDCKWRLSGHVHSSITHENLNGATVVLVEKGQAIITDLNGDFRFENLCSGQYTIRITHANFDTMVRQINLQQNQHEDIDLVPIDNQLGAVVVTGTRSGLTGPRQELSGRELEEAKGLSLAEALSKITGVSMLQTGPTVSKPIIHGLHSNRVLTINNGIRQEGQQWGNEHAPEIDPFIANKLTVIKGVDELRYGSDAIGGVVLVEPRALRNTPGYNAEVNTMYFTNNRQYVVSGVFEQQLKTIPALTYRLQGTYRKAADVATPNYTLNNTAFEQKTFSATAGWRKEHFQSELYYSLFNTQVGIFSGSHIGNLSDLQTAISQPRPDPVHTDRRSYNIDRPMQDVTHHLLKSKSTLHIGNGKFNLILGAQLNNRREFDVVRNAPARGAQLSLSINTFSEELNWESGRRNGFATTAGIVAMQQDNSYSGRYLIPNFRSYSYGAYFLEKWELGRWDAQAGVRFDYKDINTVRFFRLQQTFEAYQFEFATFASSLNIGYRLTPDWKLNTTLSLSNRAPHVNELLVDGVHHGLGVYEEGNINLKPERSVNVAVNSHFTVPSKRFTLDVTLYRNQIQNFIYQQPKPDEPVLTIRGAFPKIVYESTNALLQGIDATAQMQLTGRFSLQSRYAMLRARNQRINDWMIFMPADRIANELSYGLKDGKRFKNTYLSIELQNVFQQTRVPSDANGKQDYQPAPTGYALLNADLSTTIPTRKSSLTIGITARNVLNQAYRDYLNFFRYYTDELGRNISFRLTFKL
jgi:iron complex outermembrane receptor protein